MIALTILLADSDHMGDWGTGWWIAMVLMMIVFWALVIFGVVWLGAGAASLPGGGTDDPTAIRLFAVLHNADAEAEALDLAEQCGGRALARRVLAELHAAGSRPRRPRLEGPESLTEREADIAELASSGMTNGEIAEQLVVPFLHHENSASQRA